MCGSCREAVAGWLIDASVAVSTGSQPSELEVDCPTDGRRVWTIREQS